MASRTRRSVAANLRRLNLLIECSNSSCAAIKFSSSPSCAAADTLPHAPRSKETQWRRKSCTETSRDFIRTISPQPNFIVGSFQCRNFSATSGVQSPEAGDNDSSRLAQRLPIEKILIANRGEIACRVIQTARRLGIKTVSVFSDADRNAKHVKIADEAVRIGPAPATLSYLSGPAILTAARATNAHAVHPGYGFLSENVKFAELCTEQGISFIGPPASAIHAMGDKSVAKKLMSEAGVPIVPGYHGDDQTVELLKEEANRIGYPVLIKATQGGGGKGMRIVERDSEFVECLSSAQREALSAFGNSQVLIEKYISRPRHIEVQIFGDKHGNVVHLFERDCSVQRRHQKIIEEAPAPGVLDDFREEIGLAAVNAAKAVGYESAGTVEFILDTNSGDFYFMEMNTRLQVEHPITEMITGQDLVEWQIRVANGDRLPLLQEDLKLSGHAFEARIYAENVPRGFLPAVGTLHHYNPPPVAETVRVETGVRKGDTVSVFYDPMIAKLVTWGYDRSAALGKLHNCLSKFQIAGLPTNIPFLKSLAKHPAFVAGEVETGFIENYRSELLPGSEEIKSQSSVNATTQEARAARRAAAIAAVGMCLRRNSGRLLRRMGGGSAWNALHGFRVNHLHTFATQFEWTSDTVANFSIPINLSVVYQKDLTFKVQVEGEDPLELHIAGRIFGNGDENLRVDVDGLSAVVSLVDYFQDGAGHVHLWEEDQHYHYTVPWQLFDTEGFNGRELGRADGQAEKSSKVAAGAVTAPMAGRISKVLVENGARVRRGDSLVVLEAMKMEHVVKSHMEGIVEGSELIVGQQVTDGSVLCQIKAPAEKVPESNNAA